MSDFGRSVAVSSEYVFVGAPLEMDEGDPSDPDDDVPNGAVHVYDRSTLGGAAAATIRGIGNEPGDFGRALAMDEDGGFYVSDPFHDTVYYYENLQTTNPDTYDNPQTGSADFAYAIVVAGDVLFVADPDAIYSDLAPGAVYLFDATTRAVVQTYENPNEKCMPEATLSGVPAASTAYLTQTAVVIANPSDSNNAGLITVVGFGNPITIDAPEGGSPVAGDMLGYDVVKVDETHFLASAPGRTDTVEAEGVVYLFDATTGNVVQTFRNPDPEQGDRFGAMIRVEGDNVLISSLPEGTGPKQQRSRMSLQTEYHGRSR